MFNTLFEHFSFCQSLLKEWGRLPSAGLIEGVIGKRGFHAIFPLGEVGNDLWSLCYSISPSLSKMIGYCLEWIAQNRDVPKVASLLLWWGATEGLILIEPKVLRVFRCILRRNSSPSLTSCEWNKGEGQKGKLLSS